MNIRSRYTDGVVFGVWAALLFTGQCVLWFECRPLEWAAFAWLAVGIFVVRRTSALPLLVATCPAFMCEMGRKWAWIQAVLIVLVAVRVLVESRLTFRQYLVILFCGVLVLFLSWPRDIASVLQSLGKFGKGEIILQFIRPKASWAVFPLRQALERGTVAVLVAGMLVSGKYVSTARLWKALCFVGLAALVATFGSTLLPWRVAHTFLGTTNHGVYSSYLFHGAGYNLSFFTILLILGVPMLFVPIKWRWRSVCLGAAGLLLSAVWIPQRAYYVAAFLMIGIGVLHLVHGLRSVERRRRLARHWRLGRRERWCVAACLGVALVLSVLWYLKLGITDSSSLLREEVGRMFSAERNVYEITPYIYGTLAFVVLVFVAGGFLRRAVEVLRRAGAGGRCGRFFLAAALVLAVCLVIGVRRYLLVGDVPEGGGAGNPERVDSRNMDDGAGDGPRVARLKGWLLRRDKARGRMWSLGAQSILRDNTWRGAGAGMWARFHKRHKSHRVYFAHMHCTYLDLMFEYGLVPTVIVLVLSTAAVLRILLVPGTGNRLWIFYLAGVAVMAIGQHLLYATTSICMLLPAFVVIPRTLMARSGERQA
ncbi:hypothetical protein ACFLQU_02155 [Verrucomicrobiota bacterium]